MRNHTSPASHTPRFTALDILRGLTICLMIIVNTPGNEDTTFAILKHADWNGCTLADLVFPSFLFAVGNSLSFSSQRWHTESSHQVIKKIIKRTILIFLIGFLLHWFPFVQFDGNSHLVFSPLSQVRIMGVLQRIAICYAITALLSYYTDRYVVLFWGFGVLIVYWVILVWFGEPGNEYTPDGNAVFKLDAYILGTNHLYSEKGLVFDPEGILSTLPALFNVIAGYFAGIWLQEQKITRKTLGVLSAAGLCLIAVAFMWNSVFPFNKKFWTSSYALLSVGIDYILLTGILFCTDFLSVKKGCSFFLAFGKNPLAIYILSEISVALFWLIPVGDDALYSVLYNRVFIHAGAYVGSLLFALCWIFLCWLVALFLDKKHIYIKL